MLSLFNVEKRKEIIFILLFFIIQFKISVLKTLDNFKLEESVENEDLIYVKDYHDLSLIITTSKKLYMGFPPTLKFNLAASLTKYSNAITCNSNFVFITCLEDSNIKIINLKNGDVSDVMSIYYERDMYKSCPVSIVGDSVYFLSVESKNGNSITSQVNLIDFYGMDDETNGPTSITFGATVDVLNYESIDVDQQADLESISPYDNKNDIHIVYFYVSPESLNGKIIYILKGVIEGKTKNITYSNIITDIKAYKLNYYTIRCTIKYKQIDLEIKKEGSEYELVEVANSIKIYEEELISNSKDLIFLASGAYLKIIKTNYQNY